MSRDLWPSHKYLSLLIGGHLNEGPLTDNLLINGMTEGLVDKLLIWALVYRL